MDQNFYNDEFDSFLKQKADEYFMYPTESVWNRVKKNLFWRKNWLSVAGSVLVLSLLFFIPESLFTSIFISPAATDKPLKEGSSSNSFPSNTGTNHFKGVRGKQSASTPHSEADGSTSITEIIRQSADKSGLLERGILYPVRASDILPAHNGNRNTNTTPVIIYQPLAANIEGRETNGTEIEKSHTLKSSTSLRFITEHPIDIASHFTTTSKVAINENNQEATITEADEMPQKDEGMANFLQDMAVIQLTPKKQGRFNLQFYFSPLVSYRTLTDNNNKTYNGQANTPLATKQIDINQYVDHQPSIGVELGSNLLFRATKNVTIKTGFQMNYSRYAIKAYRAGYQKASIALNTFGPVGDTITSFTTIRNFDGYVQQQLQNQYVQISVPIGAELKLLGNKRLQLNIAGTIQPTLLLFNDTYLLSTDYLNYTKEPSLVRKWNVHTSAEVYLSYQLANVRWQVGPQFRYQMLSSYNDRYPIHEYLMEYGIKFGISKTLR